MHGRNRKSATLPPRISRAEAQENLKKIAACIRTHNPDILALQEVDAYSVLSGGFDQYDFLRTKLSYPYSYFAPSCSVGLFVSGNAIFSRFPLANCAAYSFDPTFPTDRMGFVVADAKLPDGKKMTVISLHLVYLDWLRKNSRAQELKLVEKVLKEREGDAVIAGDFNCDLVGKESSLRDFVKSLGLRVHEAQKATYPAWNPQKSIDWILTSPKLAISPTTTLEDQLSDHLAVLALCQ